MKQFERYIFRRMALLTFWSLVSATLLVLTTQVLLRLNVLTTSEQAFTAFLKVSAFLVPSVFVIVTPFALLIGVGQVLTGMNSDSELVVMEASGAGPGTIFRPVFLLSLGIALITLLVGNLVQPWSNRQLSKTIAEASADLFSVAVRTGNFQKIDEGLYVHINEAYPKGEFGGIFLSDRRTDGQEMIYFADRGRLVRNADERYLVLAEGQAQQRDEDSDNVSIVAFSSYALDLTSFLPRGGSEALRPRERSTLYLLDPPAEDYHLKHLPQTITSEIVERLTGWMYPLAFGLVCFVFLGKAHSNRTDQVNSVAMVAAVVLAVRGFGFYSADEAGLSPPMRVAAFAVPMTTIALFFGMAATGRTLKVPQKATDAATSLAERAVALYQRVTGWRDRRTDAA